MRYAYDKIIAEQARLGIGLSSAELTIRADKEPLFEAYVLICKLLNINIDNQTNYLTFEPTEKQRTHLEKLFEIKSSPSDTLQALKDKA